MGEDDLLLRFAAPRFSRRAFPAYRFMPGRHPHPTADPAGHSYQRAGEIAPTVLPVSLETWWESEEYLFGCDLYNHAYWWESHEAWEELWRMAEPGSVQREYLHGLIQAAACHLQLHQGRLGGVERLRSTSGRRLGEVARRTAGSAFMGVRVAEFCGRFESYYERLLRWKGSTPVHVPSAFPYLSIEK